MSRLTLENVHEWAPRVMSDMRYAGAVASIVANKTIPDSGPPIWGYDAGNTARTITLPTASEGKFILIANIATGTAVLTVQNAAATVITTVSAASLAIHFCIGGIWYGMTVPEALSGAELALLDGVTAGTVTASKAVAVDSSRNVDNFGVTGSVRLGLFATSQWSAFGSTATTQPTSANEAAVTSIVGTTAVAGASNTVVTSTTPYGFTTSNQATSVLTAVNSLVLQVNSISTQLNSVLLLANTLRGDLVNLGLIKGS